MSMSPIHITIDLILQICAWCTKAVIPQKQGLWLFGSNYGRLYTGNTRTVFEYLSTHEQDNKTDIWITSNKKIYLDLKQKGLPVYYKYSFGAFFAIARAEQSVISHGHTDIDYFPFPTTSTAPIQLWHGTGFKNIARLHTHTQDRGVLGYIKHKLRSILVLRPYKTVIATSPSDKDRKQKSFKTKNVIITGSPRNDILFKPGITKDTKQKLQIETYDTVILYAPTFRDTPTSEPFSDNFWPELDHYLKSSNAIFLIKKHPADTTFMPPTSFSNIRDISKVSSDIQPVLTATDILITDYSGVVTDYVLTNKPVIFYTYDYTRYVTHCRDFYYDLKQTLPGPFIENERELLLYLKDLEWFSTAEYKKKYEHFVNKFHSYKDGNSTQRVLQSIRK